jgi:hypothetical protein
VLEALVALLQPVGMDARTLQRLDELELRIPVAPQQAKRPAANSLSNSAARLSRSRTTNASWNGARPSSDGTIGRV